MSELNPPLPTTDSPTEASRGQLASLSCSALTPETLSAALKDMMPSPRPMGTHFLSQPVMTAIEKEAVPDGDKPPVYSTLFGLPMFAMPNQKSDCIVINNKKIAEAYKDGVISEKLLLSIMEQNAGLSGGPL